MRLWLTLVLLLVSATAAHPCRLALAIALDVSGSVDQTEYRLQLDGLADAFADPDVTAALFAMPGAPVSVAIYEWSSSDYQRLIQDWVPVVDQTVLDGVVARLRSWTREAAPEATGLGAAMEYGKALIDRGPSCWKATLDISGDGRNNDWPTPRDLKASGILAGIAINGLVVSRDGLEVSEDAGGLPAYFRARVIQGPDAFVEVAGGFEDYARAMRRKLLRELATRPVGQLEAAPRRVAVTRY